MRSLPILLALAVLTLPLAAAEPAPTVQKDDIGRSADRAFIHQVSTFHYAPADAYDGRFRFWLPEAATNFSLAVISTGLSAVAPSSILQTGAEAGFRSYEADLRQALPELPADREYRVFLAFGVSPGGEVPLRTWYSPGVLIVEVDTENGAVIDVQGLGVGGPVQDHLVVYKENLAANTTYTVVTNCCAADAADRTPWLYGVGGLLLGALLVLMAARMGIVKGTTKAKRFEKGGSMESRTMLEARRRTLLAALKDLEHAHEAKEVPDDAYAPLKEEYKAQAVRVMRNLEEKKEG